MGWEVVLCLTDGRYHRASRYADVYGISNYISLKNPSGTSNGRVLAAARIIESEKPDLITYVYVACVLDAVRYMRGKNTNFSPKVVLPLHVNYSGFYKELRNNADIIDAVVTPNQFMLEHTASSSGFPGSRIYYAQCGVEDANRHPRRDSDQIFIGYCGRIVQENKRIMDVARFCEYLCADHDKFHLYIAGTGIDEEEFFRKLEKSIGGSMFTRLGMLAVADMQSDFFNQIDVLLITSDCETGPLVAWEAMANRGPGFNQ